MKYLVEKLNLAFKIPYHALIAQKWSPYSKLLIESDKNNWVLHSIAGEMNTVCRNIGIDLIDPRFLKVFRNQCIFYTSKYDVLYNWKKTKNRIYQDINSTLF